MKLYPWAEPGKLEGAELLCPETHTSTQINTVSQQLPTPRATQFNTEGEFYKGFHLLETKTTKPTLPFLLQVTTCELQEKELHKGKRESQVNHLCITWIHQKSTKEAH